MCADFDAEAIKRDTAEVHRLRGEFLSELVGTESWIDTALGMALGISPANKSGALIRRFLGHISMTHKVELLRECLSAAGIQEDFASFLVELKAAVETRNALAHSVVELDWELSPSGSVELTGALRSTRTTRSGPSSARVELDELRAASARFKQVPVQLIRLTLALLAYGKDEDPKAALAEFDENNPPSPAA